MVFIIRKKETIVYNNFDVHVPLWPYYLLFSVLTYYCSIQGEAGGMFGQGTVLRGWAPGAVVRLVKCHKCHVITI